MKKLFRSIALGIALCAPHVVNTVSSTVCATEASVQSQLGDKAYELFLKSVSNPNTVKQHSWLKNEEFKDSIGKGAELLKLAHQTSDLASQEKFFEANCAAIKRLSDPAKKEFLSYVDSLMLYKSYLTLVYGKKQFDQEFAISGKSGRQEYLNHLFEKTFKYVSDQLLTRSGMSSFNLFKKLKNDVSNDWSCYGLHTNLLSGHKETRNVKAKNQSTSIVEKTVSQESVVGMVLSYEEELMRTGRLAKAFQELTDAKLMQEKAVDINRSAITAQMAKDCYPLVKELEKELFNTNDQLNVDNVVLTFADYCVKRYNYTHQTNNLENRFDSILFKFVTNWLEGAAVFRKSEDDFSNYLVELGQKYTIPENSANCFLMMFNELFNRNFSYSSFDKNGNLETKDSWLFSPDVPRDSIKIEDMIIQKKDVDRLNLFSSSVNNKDERKSSFEELKFWKQEVESTLGKYMKKRVELSSTYDGAIKNSKRSKNGVHGAQVELIENLREIKKYLLQSCFLNELESMLTKQIAESNEYSLF